jgi:hypothetical protein
MSNKLLQLGILLAAGCVINLYVLISRAGQFPIFENLLSTAVLFIAVVTGVLAVIIFALVILQAKQG